MKGVFCFIMICCYILGSIGGFGYSIYKGQYLIAFSVAILAFMAFPKAKEYYYEGLKPNK